MKYAKSSSVMLALVAAFSMQMASAVGTTSMVQRCHGSPAADWAAIKPCPAGPFMDVTTTPQGYGQSGTMQTFPEEQQGPQADRIQGGYHPVKISPFDSL